MEPKEYFRLLKNANEAQRQGYSRAEIDAYLMQEIGMRKAQLADVVRSFPKEEMPQPITTENLLRAQAYGALNEIAPLLEALVRTPGSGKSVREVKAAIDKQRKEFERDHPALSRTYNVLGAIAPAGLAAKGTGAVLRGAGKAAEAARVAGAGRLAGAVDFALTNPITMGAAQGAAGGAILGLPFDQAGAGAATGGALGAAGALIPPMGPMAAAVPGAARSGLRELLPLIGAGGVSAGLMRYLMGDN